MHKTCVRIYMCTHANPRISKLYVDMYKQNCTHALSFDSTSDIGVQSFQSNYNILRDFCLRKIRKISTERKKKHYLPIHTITYTQNPIYICKKAYFPVCLKNINLDSEANSQSEVLF